VTPGLGSAPASARDDVRRACRAEGGPRAPGGVGDGAAGCGGEGEAQAADWDALGATSIASVVAGRRAPAVAPTIARTAAASIAAATLPASGSQCEM
jgi:hypothetical protein